MMKKRYYIKLLAATLFLSFFWLFFSSWFSPVALSCELLIRPSGLEVTVNETKTVTVIRKKIHKKCLHDLNSVVITNENCQLVSQSDWVQEGFDSKKELMVSFPLAGKATITISNTCELFPIRPAKAEFIVTEAMVEQPATPVETEVNPPKSPPPENKPLPPAQATPPSPPESSNPPPSTPAVSTPTIPPSTPIPTQQTTPTITVPPQEPSIIVEPVVPTPEKVIQPVEVKWTDYFMRYQFYILIMLLLISILLNVLVKNQFRPIVQLVSVGYLGFYSGGCLCTIGLIEKAALFKLSTAMGIFSIVFLGLLVVISLIFGRVFCGWVCPQGALQEFLYRIPIKKTVQPTHRNFFSIILPGLVFMTVFLISFFARISLLCAYDPFAAAFQLTGTVAVVIILIILALFSLFSYRPFCKYVCPLGFLLGLASWAGDKLKIRWIGQSVHCTTCAQCKKECTSQALIEHNQELRISSYDCIECGNCHQSCTIQKSLKKRNSTTVKKQAE